MSALKIGSSCGLLGIGDWVQDKLSQNRIPWHIEYHKLKKFEKMAEVGRTLWPLYTLLPWKQEINICGICPPYTRRKGDIRITRSREFRARRQYKQTLLLLQHLLPILKSLCLVNALQIYCLFTIKNFLLWSLLWVAILLWVLRCMCKNSIKLMCFSPAPLP